MSTMATAASFGHVARHVRPRNDGGRTSWSARSRASSPAMSRSLAAGVKPLVSMSAHFCTEVFGDFSGESGHVGALEATRAGDVNRDLDGHPSGPARQYHDPVAEADGLAHVVGD